MNRHPLSVIDVPPARSANASLPAPVLAARAPQLDGLIRFPRLCPLAGRRGQDDGCDGQDYRRGRHPCPACGCRTMSWAAPRTGPCRHGAEDARAPLLLRLSITGRRLRLRGDA